ncbi:MAG TPA: T9SS type A sorting domain-containing protein [Bacteroidia bacterium]|nr:T9SS type A sorting domain-containing protein [Bacteroidia bacterium]
MPGKLTLTAFLLIYFPASFVCNDALAQIDLECNGRDMHSVYFVTTSGFYRVDSVDTAPTNPIFVESNPTNFNGISINNNLDSATGQQTMYALTNGGNYHFWNGTGWTDTGHTSGAVTAINPGGTSNYIFNLDGNGNSLYRYDGTSNGTLLLSNLATASACVYDVATDNAGNFYIFYTNVQKIIAYNPSGIPIDSFTTAGFPSGSNCGFTILGNRLYAHVCNLSFGLYEGIISGTTVNFSLIKTLPTGYIDIASCPNAASPLAVFENPEEPHFTLYPNPAWDNVIIKLNNTAMLEISDCTGVLKETILTRGLTEYLLDVSKWKAGVYFINVLSANKASARAKLVVQ